MAQTTLKEKTTDQITRLMKKDHEQLRELMRQLKPMLEDISCRHSPESLQQAKTIMQQIVQKLHMHAACEDQVLFPALAVDYPVRAIEAGHAEMAVLQAALVTGILSYTFPEDCSNLTLQKGTQFINLMERHFQMEETVIFPLIEEALDAEQKERLLQEIRHIRARERRVQVPNAYVEDGYQKFHIFMDEPVPPEIQMKSVLDTQGLHIKTLEMKAGTTSPDQFTSTHLLLLLMGEAIWQGLDSPVLLRQGDGLVLKPHIPYLLQAITDSRFLAVVKT